MAFRFLGGLAFYDGLCSFFLYNDGYGLSAQHDGGERRQKTRATSVLITIILEMRPSGMEWNGTIWTLTWILIPPFKVTRRLGDKVKNEVYG